jgi:hypothetical protein
MPSTIADATAPIKRELMRKPVGSLAIVQTATPTTNAVKGKAMNGTRG